MKKGIIVLLIAVLISGFAFAGTFHGSASIEFGVDLDEHTWGFANKTAGKYSFKFEFDTTKVSIGEDHKTDIWAELAAEASAYLQLGNAPLANSQQADPIYYAKITKANIHVGEITFGILNSGKAVDYAASYYKFANGTPVNNKIAGPNQVAPGFTVTYDGWYGGFGARGLWDDDSSSHLIWGHAKTKSFEFAEGLTAEAGGYAVIDRLTMNQDGYLGGGLKVDYAQEKFKAGIAGDGTLKKADIDFAIEGAIYASYAFAEAGSVRLDIYGASKQFFGYADEDFFLKLDAKVLAEYKFDLSDDIALDVTGWVDARDITIKDIYFEIGAEEATTIDAFDLFLGEYVNLFNIANDADVITTLTVDAKVTYNHEKFTAWAEVESSFIFDKDDATDTFASCGFECGISSDAIIEFATVALVYKGADFVNFEDFKGNVTASVTIPF
jgi:hypothetical protein